MQRERSFMELALMVAMCVICACTSGCGASGDGVAGEATPSVALSTTTPAAVWTMPPWHPRTPIKHRTWTEAQKQEFRTQWLKHMAETQHVSNPPKVAFVRWIGNNDPIIPQCMTEHGFRSWELEDGGMASDPYPPSQESAYQLAEYICYSKYTIDPKFSQEWTNDQIGLVYDYWTEYYVPCLAAHGVTTDPAPSRQEFIATFHDVNKQTWWPIDSYAMIASKSKKDAVRKTCPQYPSDADMWG